MLFCYDVCLSVWWGVVQACSAWGSTQAENLISIKRWFSISVGNSGKGEGGVNWEIRIDIYTLCVCSVASLRSNSWQPTGL